MLRIRSCLIRPQVSLGIGRTHLIDPPRVVNSPRLMLIVFSTIVVALEGCDRQQARDFWSAGRSYHLVVRLSARPALTPERAAYFAPVADSVELVLQLDSVQQDHAFGTYRGNTRHFPVAFASLDDSTFVSVRSREHWQITLSGDATDSGLELTGEPSHGKLKGTWQVRSSDTPHGDFTITLDARQAVAADEAARYPVSIQASRLRIWTPGR